MGHTSPASYHNTAPHHHASNNSTWVWVQRWIQRWFLRWEQWFDQHFNSGPRTHTRLHDLIRARALHTMQKIKGQHFVSAHGLATNCLKACTDGYRNNLTFVVKSFKGNKKLGEGAWLVLASGLPPSMGQNVCSNNFLPTFHSAQSHTWIYFCKLVTVSCRSEKLAFIWISNQI